jgi:hypothetical protein
MRYQRVLGIAKVTATYTVTAVLFAWGMAEGFFGALRDQWRYDSKR